MSFRIHGLPAQDFAPLFARRRADSGPCVRPPIALGSAPAHRPGVPFMTQVTYRIVRHDDGWAYKAGDVFSEPFATHAAALAAARKVAREQRVPGDTHAIEYEGADGKWHSETASGSDRPDTEVNDSAT